MASSNANASIPQLPNEGTPMAFLPPELAYQVTVSVYLIVGCAGVFVWDLLDNLEGDYELLFYHPIRLPTIAYFISRLGSLAYVLCAALFETAPLGNCARFEKAVDALFPVAVCSTSLLFFFRVRAIFDRNRWVVAFFGFMWLAVVAGCLSPIWGVVGANVGPTAYCIITSVKPYIATGAIIPLVNDTLVFLAITWRLMGFAHVDTSLKTGFRIFAFGDYMPALSAALLQDGQVYYLTTVSTSLLTVMMLYIDSVPVVYRTMFTVPNIVLMNVMACRVFRNTKFGLFRETEISSSSSVPNLLPKDARKNTRGPHRGGPNIPLSTMRFMTVDGRSHTSQAEAMQGVHEDNIFDDKVKAVTMGV